MKKLSQIIIETYQASRLVKTCDNMYDHLVLEWGNELLWESKGIPDGLRDDASYITNIIENEISKLDYLPRTNIEIDTNKLKLKIFDSLVIKIIEDNRDIEGDTLLHKEYNMNIIIRLWGNTAEFIHNKIYPVLCHELLHCYTYFLSGTLTDDNTLSKYIHNNDKISYDIIIHKANSDVENFVRSFLYQTSRNEFNAFMAQLITEIETEKPICPGDAYEVLYKNEIYQSYANLKVVLKYYKKYYPKICDIYRSLVPKDKNCKDETIINKFKRTINYIDKRLQKVIPRVCYENQATHTVCSKKLLFQLKDIPEYNTSPESVLQILGN